MTLMQSGLDVLVGAAATSATATPASFPTSFDEAADQATTKLIEKAKPWIIGSLIVTVLAMTASTFFIMSTCSRR